MYVYILLLYASCVFLNIFEYFCNNSFLQNKYVCVFAIISNAFDADKHLQMIWYVRDLKNTIGTFSKRKKSS